MKKMIYDHCNLFELKMEAGNPFDDGHSEVNRGKFEVKVPQDLSCESKNQIVKLCINPACTFTSLTCDK